MEINPLGLADRLRMMKGVEPMTPPSNGVDKAPGAAGEKTTSFAEFLENQFKEVNSVSLDAEKKVQDSIEGKIDNPHETIIALQKADISFRLMLSVKQQLESAYQQIMRTSIG